MGYTRSMSPTAHCKKAKGGMAQNNLTLLYILNKGKDDQRHLQYIRITWFSRFTNRKPTFKKVAHYSFLHHFQ
uniref:Uncharacterized protein n=1 Tax=Anguilla anguilla TaxID=7936 RepID=A0A0E9U761_ANGAN